MSQQILSELEMDNKTEKPLLGFVYASMFGAVTAIGAFIAIPLPFSPVPITLQTLFLFLAAALLGGRLGAMSQIVYIALGLIGLPVFAGGKAGFGVLLGPSGGYLYGFVLGAFISGMIVSLKEKPGIAWIMLSLCAAVVAIYSCGVLQLAAVASLSLQKSLMVGALPFLPGDAVKIAAAALIAVKVRDKIKLTGIK
jgi:biotin transport system substrate-specific component